MIGYKLVQREESSLRYSTPSFGDPAFNGDYLSKRYKDYAILTIEVLGDTVTPISRVPSKLQKYRTNTVKILKAENLHRKEIKQTKFYPLYGNSIHSWKELNRDITSYEVGEKYEGVLDYNMYHKCSYGIGFFKSKSDCIKFLKRI